MTEKEILAQIDYTYEFSDIENYSKNVVGNKATYSYVILKTIDDRQTK